MTHPAGLVLPKFFLYYDSPVKLVRTEDGGMAGWRLSLDNGRWQPANDLVDRVLFGRDDEIFEINPEEFVWYVEQERGLGQRGDGPISALYETVRAIQDTLREERRYPTPTEQALIKRIRRRTFVMFEEELQRAGDPGADPTVVSLSADEDREEPPR
ncbi:hypothetical protein [Micromonospora sp. LA-10]|uniref:hypothetical protein n=1 Tax=Micromonospora sp. LA-10 TaxID=3446364 RepID=UPI003F71FCE2